MLRFPRFRDSGRHHWRQFVILYIDRRKNPFATVGESAITTRATPRAFLFEPRLAKNLSMKLMKLSLITLTIFLSHIASASTGSRADCFILSGTKAVSAALRTNNSGRGTLPYWLRTFELFRDLGNRTAKSLRYETAPLLQDSSFRLLLEDIAGDLEALPQEGYGDASYWLEKTNEQNRVFNRAAVRLLNLENQACE